LRELKPSLNFLFIHFFPFIPPSLPLSSGFAISSNPQRHSSFRCPPSFIEWSIASEVEEEKERENQNPNFPIPKMSKVKISNWKKDELIDIHGPQ
jgi:hypothetical protein